METRSSAVTGPARPTLSLVLPAYNEGDRLPETLAALTHFLAARPSLRCEILVVDNASSDQTSEAARAAMADNPCIRLLRTDRRGKGCAVRAGVLAATGEIIAFGDADLSWSLSALEHFADLIDDEVAIVIGSREGDAARRIGEPGYRHLMGRVFNRLVQFLVVPGIEDTQCGFKAFRADAARDIFRRQLLDGFAFDVEVLYLARSLGYPVVEEPICWEHKAQSRVQPVRDTISMLRDILAVRLNALCGRYHAPLAPRRVAVQ